MVTVTSGRLSILAAVATLVSVAILITVPGPAKAPYYQPVNARDTVAMHGYDPVAYFIDGEARRGSPEHTTTHNHFTYQFESEDNLAFFEADPDAYLPEFGGFSVYGVTKQKTYDVNPEVFNIIDGKLYLSRNRKVQELWQVNPEGYIETARRVWAEIPLGR
ncbi:MAG: hypothetical protein HOH65_22910 [Rhodospirillaceae bacterium]|jgi:hypothetical protein|nr:hypothetical protein [Rhodospirillaceae bacterium]